MLKKQKSHLTITSNEDSLNNKGTNSKQSLNNKEIEQCLNKLILISLKQKKFLEKNDYFYRYTKLKTNNNTTTINMKKIKLKLTPFQKYENYKMNLQKIKSNLIPDPNKQEYIKLLEPQKNKMKKNKTLENNRFCLTNFKINLLI